MSTPMHGRDEQRQPLATLLDNPDPRMDLPDVTGTVREFNAANPAHEDLWARIHQAGDALRRARKEERLAREAAREAYDAHLVVQAEHPQRRAPLLQQVSLALLTVVLDGVACWFAAQALGNGQVETMLWTGLFLSVLAGGEVALDHYSDRGGRAWRLLAFGLGAFIAGLGVLRYLYLATVGNNSVIAALVGAGLFTTVTSGFVLVGYRALRAAERYAAWKARRRSRRASREAAATGVEVACRAAERDRLVDAYLSRIRISVLKTCGSVQPVRMEAALRAHLLGHDAS